MKSKILNVNIKNPTVEIISNVTALPQNNPKKIKNLLIEQIEKPVRWREGVNNMIGNGVNKFLEVGPGKVLSGMVKRTLKGVNCFSINSIADIKTFINELKK